MNHTARDLVQKRNAGLNPGLEGTTRRGEMTSPLPSPTQESPESIRTLTNLYNKHPTWLDLAYRKLDEAVLDAYGRPHVLSDEDILARLLVLNLERAGG